MGKPVTMKTLIKQHPNKFVIATVAMRDADTKRAKTFNVLKAVRDTAEMKRAVEYYQREMHAGVVVIPNFTSDDVPDFPPEYAALLFRTLYHEQEATV